MTSIDANYQMNALQNKNSNTNLSQIQFNHSNTTSARQINLNGTNSLYMYSPLKTSHQSQNFYAATQPRYDLTAPSIAYLHTANTDVGSGLYFSNTNNQHNTNSLATTSIPTGYVTTASTFADLAYGTIGSAKALTHPFSTKNPYSTSAICLNGLKKRKRRYKKPPELRKVLPKNSLMLLHEFRPNIEYRFLCQSGPIHRPLFTMCVDINEHKFEGTGKTKKEARMMAAERALEFLIQNPEYIQKPAPGQNLSTASISEKDCINTIENNSDEDDDVEDDDSIVKNSSVNTKSDLDKEETAKRFKKENAPSESLSAESKS